MVRHELLPLLVAQRRQTIAHLPMGTLTETIIGVGMGAAAANPAIFALALQASHPGNQAEGLLDAWLAVVCSTAAAANKLSSDAFDRVVHDVDKLDRLEVVSDEPTLSLREESANTPLLAASSVAQELLAARHLVSLGTRAAIDLFRRAPLVLESVIRSTLLRLETLDTTLQDDLIRGLIGGNDSYAQRGALLVADLIDENSEFQEQILRHALEIINKGTLTASERDHAGRILSRLGDPRDLTGLAFVPAGTFTFGSINHPNSQPVAKVKLAQAFRIGLYPVVNRDYAAFVHETGCDWLSPDGTASEMQNVPATDLTWYDARAYCAWLTEKWRADGTIAASEEVRLPTEPEWERAARGDQTTNDSDVLYPWGTQWLNDGANSEETGFNRQCTVGLFPAGRSPYGCYDMAGQVWEWCTTLWGDDMATPSFEYPYRADDGREALGDDIPGNLRRVLRGGCFSSGRTKACCTYRGSLEPAGFWRGNGFRIVVAEVISPAVADEDIKHRGTEECRCNSHSLSICLQLEY
ncbi:C-type lectin protein [Xylariales sp. PMI_506]|nr:C-type lectin protein [Xylariales sp. PMI_506]